MYIQLVSYKWFKIIFIYFTYLFVCLFTYFKLIGQILEFLYFIYLYISIYMIWYYFYDSTLYHLQILE